ncbi:MAG TPA: nitroreductase family protein [Terracidiphilus sp.]|jgi:nitroreductase
MGMTVSEVNKIKESTPASGILPIIHQRWSARAFSEKSVAVEDLKRVFEAARWAPSSSNEQPWRYIVGTRGTETHKRIFESLIGFNQQWAGKAPVLILGVAKATTSRNNTPNPYALYDLGAATGFLVLQATALGLMTHQMGGFDREKARALLAVPEGFDFGSVMALGYQDHPETLGNEELIKREMEPRQRKPLHEFVYASWGEELKL